MVQLPAVLLMMSGLVLAAQWQAGAYQAEWTFNPDEPTHQVSGLMVHDYLAILSHGNFVSPLRFAETFYQHYPKIAIGHWPPGFYFLQGVWTLLFAPSRTSILILMALVSASVLTFCYAILVRHYDWWIALGSVAWLATVPVYQQFSRSVMPDLPGCLIMLGAIAALAWHLEKPRWLTATVFALTAVAAILTRLTTIGLAILPIAAVWFLRRRALLRNKAFWFPALIVAAMCLPWFLAAPGALHSRVAFLGGMRFRWYRPLESIYHWAVYLGPVGASLVAIGAARLIRDWHLRRPIETMEALFFLAFPVVMVLRTLVGAWEYNYLVSTLPLALPMLCLGVDSLMARFRARRWQAHSLAAMLFAAGLTWNLAHATPKVHLGLDTVAEHLAASSPHGTFLIVSDSTGEGVFVAEVALRDQRPGHVVLRGSKVLSDDSWMGGGEKVRFASAEGMQQYLETLTDLVLVLDPAALSAPYARVLEEAVSQRPERWEEIEERHTGSRRGIRVLRLRG